MNFTLTNLLTAVAGTAHRFCLSDADSDAVDLNPVDLNPVDLNGISFHTIKIDSRKIRGGELFWAIPGKQHNGHDYVNMAFQQGAVAAVVDANRHKKEEYHGPVITVDCSLEALGRFASWQRQQQDAMTIGVTGSFGKTTTREMIHAVLSESFTGTRSPKNFNNQIGVPLSMLQMSCGDEYLVLEMGASQRGEIAQLANIASPEIGVITGIGLSHLDGFETYEGIIEAKSELLTALPKSGFAVLFGDDPTVRTMAERANCRTIFVGEKEGNHLQATDVTVTNQSVSFFVDQQRYTVSATGRHHLEAALFAIAVAREIGMSPQTIADGLQRFVPVAGRCQLEAVGPWNVIDDSYNANPQSMRAACDVLKNWQGGGQKIFVAGDMLGLGEQTEECHRELGRLAAEAKIDQFIAYGKQSQHILQGARDAGMELFQLADCDQLESLTMVLDCWLEPESVVLVKGSRAMQMERVIEWLKNQAKEIEAEQKQTNLQLHFAQNNSESMVA